MAKLKGKHKLTVDSDELKQITDRWTQHTFDSFHDLDYGWMEQVRTGEMTTTEYHFLRVMWAKTQSNALYHLTKTALADFHASI